MLAPMVDNSKNQMGSMPQDLSVSLKKLIRARLLVGFLGEGAQHGWWLSAFYEGSSKAFLAPVFPRTQHLAQYRGVLEAACRAHDENLPAAAFHLFRLPEETEQRLHQLALESPETVSLERNFSDPDSAVSVLNDLSEGSDLTGVGPVAIGNVADVMRRLPDVASVYRRAFASGGRSYPYFTR